MEKGCASPVRFARVVSIRGRNFARIRIFAIKSRRGYGLRNIFIFGKILSVALHFNDIYKEHHRRVYNFCLNYLQSLEDAEEVTQDVFVRIHLKLHTFNNQSQLSTWIYRICVNCCIDFLKAKKRKKRFGFLTSLFYEDSSEIRHEVGDFNHPGVALEQKEAVAALFAHIDTLPFNQKTVLLLSKIEQKSQKEIAAVMDISEKAVESLLHRAKENLHKKINTRE
ncbi:RNA polymerase sigma factor [Flavobacterium pallidum]|uniref:RNA polymerase sigma factor n=1 Tax=Flavobacterium pallidum TaxID=2172098 RepID=UPI001C635420|nr:RNA polymerase sigma factor [Flavobacterium pallidum]